MTKLVTKALVIVALSCFTSTFCAAQSWPQRPVKMIVPFAAGGGIDFVARVIGRHLSQRLGREVYIENRPGANGAIALQALMQSEPDGHTIAMSSDSPLTVNPTLYSKLPYDPQRDFVPVARVATFPVMLAAHPSVEARNVKDLIALAKKKPDGLAYASAGVGNFNHLAMELFSLSTGTKFVHVPYKGTGPASLGVLAGEVQLMFNNVQLTLEHVQAGQLVALAVGESKRMPELPDIPTVAETVPGFDMAPWAGLIAPAKTPKDIVLRLSQETLAIVQLPEVAKSFADQHVTPSALGPDEFGELTNKETGKWAAVIKTIGLKVD
jgi:tripartite-type tricarboxylate transporter receptor subunit TctC